jgi:hypothetical protein
MGEYPQNRAFAEPLIDSPTAGLCRRQGDPARSLPRRPGVSRSGAGVLVVVELLSVVRQHGSAGALSSLLEYTFPARGTHLVPRTGPTAAARYSTESELGSVLSPGRTTYAIMDFRKVCMHPPTGDFQVMPPLTRKFLKPPITGLCQRISKLNYMKGMI